MRDSKPYLRRGAWLLVTLALTPALPASAAQGLAVLASDSEIGSLPLRNPIVRRIGERIEARLGAQGHRIVDSDLQGFDRLARHPSVDIIVVYAVHADVTARTYTTRAALRVEARLISVPDRRLLGRIAPKPEPRRVHGGCTGTCLAAFLAKDASRIADRAAISIHRRLSDSGEPSRSYALEFTGFPAGLSSRIEEYLAVFPGYRGHLAAPSRSGGTAFRLAVDAGPAAVARALKKALGHLGFAASVSIDRGSISIERSAAAARAANEW